MQVVAVVIEVLCILAPKIGFIAAIVVTVGYEIYLNKRSIELWKAKQVKEYSENCVYSAPFTLKAFYIQHISAVIIVVACWVLFNDVLNERELMEELIYEYGSFGGSLIIGVIYGFAIFGFGLFAVAGEMNGKIQFGYLMFNDEELFMSNPGESGYRIRLNLIKSVTVSKYIPPKSRKTTIYDKIVIQTEKGNSEVFGVKNAFMAKAAIEKKLKEIHSVH